MKCVYMSLDENGTNKEAMFWRWEVKYLFISGVNGFNFLNILDVMYFPAAPSPEGVNSY